MVSYACGTLTRMILYSKHGSLARAPYSLYKMLHMLDIPFRSYGSLYRRLASAAGMMMAAIHILGLLRAFYGVLPARRVTSIPNYVYA